MFNFESFNDAYNFLKNNAGYQDNSFLNQKPNEDTFKYQSRIIQIANRIRACIETYPRDILSYYKEHQDQAQYTKEEIYSMSYKELSELRTSLGIKKRRRKKVTHTEPAKKAYIKGKETIKNTKTRELAANVILANEEKDKKEETILSQEELTEMYGEDLPTTDYLLSIGIVPEYPIEYEKRRKL